MNSKLFREFDRIELYVNAEELHFLTYAATDFIKSESDFIEYWQKSRAIMGKAMNSGELQKLRLCTNHLQELSMKLRAMEVHSP